MGAPPPPPDSVGLRAFTIRVPDAQEVERLADRLWQAGVVAENTSEDGPARAIRVHDPDGIGIEVRAGD